MTPPCFPATVCDKVPSFPFTGSRGKVRPLHWYYEDTPTSAVLPAGACEGEGRHLVTDRWRETRWGVSNLVSVSTQRQRIAGLVKQAPVQRGSVRDRQSVV